MSVIVRITAGFADGGALETALGDLRRMGAVRCLPPLGAAEGSAVLHVTVRGSDAAMTRAILRAAGGKLSP